MRIFIPTAIFHPDSGGPATYLHTLIPDLIARGIEPTVLTFGDGPADGYGYPVTRVSLQQGLLARRRAYLRHYREQSIAAYLSYINNLGLPRPRAEGTEHPRVLKVVGDFAWERAVNRGWVPPATDIDVFQRARLGPRVEALKWMRAREVQTVDHVIVPSEYLRQMVIGWGAPPERVTVILNAFRRQPEDDAEGANGMPVPAAEYESRRRAARQALGIPEDAPIILTVARLTAWKGVDYLIDAVASTPAVMLLIAGEGPQGEELRAQAERLGLGQRVRFLGKVDRARVADLMRAADYLALYSGYEGLAHVLLESFAVGTPVIASRRGGNPEVVTDRVNGFLVPHPDREALRAALREAFRPGVRTELAANIARGAHDGDPASPFVRFRWETMVDRTFNLLRRYAEGR